jgi:hypothetical protein
MTIALAPRRARLLFTRTGNDGRDSGSTERTHEVRQPRPVHGDGDVKAVYQFRPTTAVESL